MDLVMLLNFVITENIVLIKCIPIKTSILAQGTLKVQCNVVLLVGCGFMIVELNHICICIACSSWLLSPCYYISPPVMYIAIHRSPLFGSKKILHGGIF